MEAEDLKDGMEIWVLRYFDIFNTPEHRNKPLKCRVIITPCNQILLQQIEPNGVWNKEDYNEHYLPTTKTFISTPLELSEWENNIEFTPVTYPGIPFKDLIQKMVDNYSQGPTEEQLKELMLMTGKLWNKYVSAHSMNHAHHADDLTDFRQSIHTIQRILSTQQLQITKPDFFND